MLTRRFCSPVPGHPIMMKAAVLDIITPDMKNGMTAAGAEIILLLSDCLRSFPNLALSYEIHVSHSRSESIFWFSFVASTSFQLSN